MNGEKTLSPNTEHLMQGGPGNKNARNPFMGARALRTPFQANALLDRHGVAVLR